MNVFNGSVRPVALLISGATVPAVGIAVGAGSVVAPYLGLAGIFGVGFELRGKQRGFAKAVSVLTNMPVPEISPLVIKKEGSRDP